MQCGKASGDILRLELTRTIGKFLPGMFVEVQCGRLGALDWHPFTLASPAQTANEGGKDTIVLYIKAQVCASDSLPLSLHLSLFVSVIITCFCESSFVRFSLLYFLLVTRQRSHHPSSRTGPAVSSTRCKTARLQPPAVQSLMCFVCEGRMARPLCTLPSSRMQCLCAAASALRPSSLSSAQCVSTRTRVAQARTPAPRLLLLGLLMRPRETKTSKPSRQSAKAM